MNGKSLLMLIKSQVRISTSNTLHLKLQMTVSDYIVKQFLLSLSHLIPQISDHKVIINSHEKGYIQYKYKPYNTDIPVYLHKMSRLCFCCQRQTHSRQFDLMTILTMMKHQCKSNLPHYNFAVPFWILQYTDCFQVHFRKLQIDHLPDNSIFIHFDKTK